MRTPNTLKEIPGLRKLNHFLKQIQNRLPFTVLQIIFSIEFLSKRLPGQTVIDKKRGRLMKYSS